MELKDYQRVTMQIEGLISGESNLIANLANISAVLGMELTEINWVGFYLKEGDQLVLGPFQGKPACVRIDWGKGVCGTAAATNQTLRIEDVHQFKGHIACDAASNSEIVIPFTLQGEVCGVLDIDSPKFSRFSEVDQQGLEFLMKKVEELLNTQAICG
jgi:GAF domain-containing protein